MLLNTYTITLCNPLNNTARHIKLQATSFSDVEKKAKLVTSQDEYIKSIEILDF